MMKLFRMKNGITISADSDKAEIYLNLQTTIPRNESEELCEVLTAAINWLRERQRLKAEAEKELATSKQNADKRGNIFGIWGGM